MNRLKRDQMANEATCPASRVMINLILCTRVQIKLTQNKRNGLISYPNRGELLCFRLILFFFNFWKEGFFIAPLQNAEKLLVDNDGKFHASASPL